MTAANVSRYLSAIALVAIGFGFGAFYSSAAAQAQDAQRLQIERLDVIKGLLEAYEMAKAQGNPAAMISGAGRLADSSSASSFSQKMSRFTLSRLTSSSQVKDLNRSVSTRLWRLVGLAVPSEPPFGAVANPLAVPGLNTSGSTTSDAAPLDRRLPADFDTAAFERIAKTIFIRLQAANDERNLDDLRAFSTPEMFAELRTDLLERGTDTQQTEVLSVNSTIVDFADEGDHRVVLGDVRHDRGEASEVCDRCVHHA